MNEPCPWCGAEAVDITTNDDVSGFDQRARYMCVGPETHEWRAGDGPEPVQESLIILATH
jgi:hypothetical protein